MILSFTKGHENKDFDVIDVFQAKNRVWNELIQKKQKIQIHFSQISFLNPHTPDRFTPHAPGAQKIADQRWLIAG